MIAVAILIRATIFVNVAVSIPINSHDTPVPGGSMDVEGVLYLCRALTLISIAGTGDVVGGGSRRRRGTGWQIITTPLPLRGRNIIHGEWGGGGEWREEGGGKEATVRRRPAIDHGAWREVGSGRK